MIALPVGASASRRRDARRLALSVGLVLIGLWVIQAGATADAVFAPLSVLTAQATAAMLAAIGLPVVRELTVLAHAGGFACEISHACTALTPAALLAAAILPQPVSRRARLIGVTAGTIALILLNQVRLVSLVWLGVHAPAYFDATHGLLWPGFLALATAGYYFGWMRTMHC